MNALIVEATKNLTMDSLEISKLTGKTHSNVLKDIEKMFKDLEMGEESQVKYYFAEQSQTWDMKRYRLPKDLTITLVSWYNAILRKAIIVRWLELEETKPQTFEEVMRNALLLADQKVKQLETKIEIDKPKVEFANTVADSSDVILVREYAKILYDKEWIEIWQNRLFKWFRDNWYLNKNNEPYQSYMQYFKVIETTTTSIFWTRINKTTKITWQWQLYFLSKLRDYFND